MSLANLSDVDLCEKWSTGDQDAGGELLERHLPGIERFFRNKVLDEADDLVQLTFMAAIEARVRFRGESSFRTFLFGIANNVLRRHIRDRVSDKVVLEEVTAMDLSRGPSTVVREHQEHRLLAEALRRIPIEHQVVFELRYWEELSTASIAQALGVAENTVRNRLRRGQELLDAQLELCARSPGELQQTVDQLARLIGEPIPAASPDPCGGSSP